MIRNAILALVFAGFAHADTTIVPLRGDVLYGADGSYYTIVEVTNISDRPISVKRGEVFPVSPSQQCGGEPVTVVIQPLQTGDVPTGCTGLYAYTLESDGPIRVDTTITTGRLVALPVGFTSSSHHQQIPAAREWLPAHQTAIIPRVEISRAGAEDGPRTNLFVTNPNDHELTLDLRLERVSGTPFRDEHYVIAPRSTAVIRLAQVEVQCELPMVCGGTHRLEMMADAPYFASASTVDYSRGDALFFAASAQEP